MKLNRRQFTAAAAASLVLGNLPVATAKILLKTEQPFYTLHPHQAIFLNLKEDMTVFIISTSEELSVQQFSDRLEVKSQSLKGTYIFRADGDHFVWTRDYDGKVYHNKISASALSFASPNVRLWDISIVTNIEEQISLAEKNGVSRIYDLRDPT